MSQAALPLIVEPNELERRLEDENLLIVDLCDQPLHAATHVPGAVRLDYAAIISGRPPAPGLLPGDEHLSRVFSSIGMTKKSHVVAYDGEGGAKACRLLWTLDAVGHADFSLLNGGLAAWLAEGHRTEEGTAEPGQGDTEVAGYGEAVADKAYVLAHLDDPQVVILDARTRAEYDGTDVRAARGGHIPGAVNMDWTLAMDGARNLRLKPQSELKEIIENLGVTPEKEVIAYCQTHHRSAHTYIVLKSLGYPRIKGYAGSWSEWGNDPELPIET